MRIIDLLESGASLLLFQIWILFSPNNLDYLGALSLLALNRIVVDCSHIDQKKRGILDMRETEGPLVRLLNRPELKNRYGIGEDDVQLIFY